MRHDNYGTARCLFGRTNNLGVIAPQTFERMSKTWAIALLTSWNYFAKIEVAKYNAEQGYHVVVDTPLQRNLVRNSRLAGSKTQKIKRTVF